MKKPNYKNISANNRTLEVREGAFALKIRQQLQQSSEELDDDIAARLKVAREHALDKQKKEETVLVVAHAPVYQSTDSALGITAPWWKNGLGWTVTALALTVALLGANEWQQSLEIDELAEIDALILADDLPLNAHLDPGFVTTLQTSE